jgi:hypothetical protein
MDSIEAHRKTCLAQQTELRRIMKSAQQHDQAIELFLCQHAMLHSAEVSQTGLWSFEDAILDDLPEEKFRRVPQGEEHSIAWLVWHIARCEDITMNLLAAGTPQILHQQGWIDKMKIPDLDTGNAMDTGGVARMSQAIDLSALRAYRQAVGCRTRQIVMGLQAEQLKGKVQPARVQQVLDQGAVVEAARGILDYWSRRDFAGLLLMPCTRHPLIHLNEALQIKRRDQ